MNTKSQRKIKRTWKVKLKKNSDVHSADLVLPYGNWEEFDPFLVMAEDKFQKNAFYLHRTPWNGNGNIRY